MIEAAQAELAPACTPRGGQDASTGEQDYLRHLAALALRNQRVTGAMVASAMDTTTKALSVPRNRLIQKGLLYPEGEAIRFSIPGMSSWVRDSQ